MSMLSLRRVGAPLLLVLGLPQLAAAQSVRTVDVVPAPCPGPMCTAPQQLSEFPGELHARGPRVVWLDFEGGTLIASASDDDAAADLSFVLSEGHSPGSSYTVPPFDPAELSDDGGLSRAELIAYVTQELEAIHAPYDIFFVLTRPEGGNYQRLVFGGTCETISGGTTCAGTAVMDCGDNMPRNIGFAHPDNIRYHDLVTTAAQEMAHAFGLNHTEDSSDIMYPELQQSFRPTAYGSGPIPMEESGCGGAIAQDSHALLMNTVGPAGQDVTAPVVSITVPANGSLIPEFEAVTAVIQATDETSLLRVEAKLDGATLGELATAPFQFELPALARGQHVVTVAAVDSSGNRGTTMASFTVGQCQVAADCGQGFTCDDQLCVEQQEPGNGQLGEACSDDLDCVSGICGTVSGDSRCTIACGGPNDCPNGFECVTGGACWRGDINDDNEENNGPFSCLQGSVSADSRSGYQLILVCALIGLGLRRRRR